MVTTIVGRTANRAQTEYDRSINAEFVDRFTGLRCVVAAPNARPEVWHDYVDGVRAAYRSWGVDDAFDFAEVATGRSTTLFCAVLDDAGEVVAGHRVQGPYIAAAQSHALVEWAGQSGQRALVDAIEDRLAGGLVEVKSAFVSYKGREASAVANLLSRVSLSLMGLTGSRHMMATAAEHVLRRWEEGGGRVDWTVPPTPYPDPRYTTRVMFWDWNRMAADASADLWPTMVTEYEALGGGLWAGSLPLPQVSASEFVRIAD
ncbi:hypothetical protein [Tsukamurella soli]|uniref:N-acetyltransferase domain-containing protein n=1 Tax=Tsukamurella soli TaxID=644556 RepID=A0ABP8J475_9ACTN